MPLDEVVPPLHPGRILAEDFLAPLGISGRALAAALRVSTSRICGVVAGGRRITADLALRLGHYFGTSPWFWMNLQVRFDLEQAQQRVPGPTAGIVPLPAMVGGADDAKGHVARP